MTETNRIEFKRQYTDDLDIEKEVIAFLNYREGGIIYIGIDDSGKPVGVEDIDNTVLKIKDKIRKNVSPSPMGLFDVLIQKIDDVDVIKIFLASGSEKPYYKTKYGMSTRGCYIRVGTAAEPMPTSMIEDLFACRVRNSLKNIPSPRQKLTFRQLHIYYESKSLMLNDAFEQTLDLLTDDGRYNYVAFLLADENNVSIKVAKYSGTDRTDLISNNEYGYCSLLKATDLVIDKLNTENYVFTHKTEKFRVDTPMWDRLAVREAVINAIVHNDYTREVPPKFEIFSDRLEITSYGTIPNGMTEDEFFSGVSLPRNKELMRVFRDVEMVEALGSGMPIILRKYTRKSYEFMTHFIRLTFSAIDEDVPKMSPKCPQNVVRNDTKSGADYTTIGITDTNNIHKNDTKTRREMIVAVIKDNKYISLSAIAKHLGLSIITTKRELAEMRHIVQHVGPTRGGHWEFL
ncbi:MAG: putative DNA binding domain-containing protein [Bacteroidales bacterium]|nr:putative DNA binding domain-containing protein [Bacteroidales bacterium]